jgi:hypothetical protein
MFICIMRCMNLVDGKASADDIRQTLGESRCHARMSIISNVCPLVVMQKLAMKVNKMERSYHPPTGASVFLDIYI